MFHTKYIQTQQQDDLSLEFNGKCEYDNEFLTDLADLISEREILSQSIIGFALKFSKLKAIGLTIEEVLRMTKTQLIVDAEAERLDLILLSKLEQKRIKENELRRITVTIQVKREDAMAQFGNLKKLKSKGLTVFLVSGHKSYFSNSVKLTQINTSDRFLEFGNSDFIKGYGISIKMKNILSNKSLQLQNKQIIELQGYQSITNSLLWTYYAGSKLTNEAIEYLKRRGRNGNYLSRSSIDLIELAKQHKLIIFLDSCCFIHYLGKLITLDQIISVRRVNMN